MHDAIQAYDQRFEPYAGAIAAGGGSPIAAAARAAHTVLFTKFPSLQSNIDTCYTASMAGVVLTPADSTASDAVGNAAAENVLFSRDGDGSFPSPASPFAGGLGPGQWRPNPTTESMAAPWGGDVRPFAIESVQRCQPDDPPLMTSAEYAEANKRGEVAWLGDQFRADAGTEPNCSHLFRGDPWPIQPAGSRSRRRLPGGQYDSQTSATVPVCSPWLTPRSPMRSSAPGIPRRNSVSGGPFMRSKMATRTAIS